MNLASLDLNLLVALDALLKEESVSRAGDRIALSQPAMSHALNKLRNALGDPVLVRVGGRMQLTLRAQALRRPVEEALDRVREIFVSDAFDPATSTRLFRVCMSDYASNLLLPALWKRLQKAAPTVTVKVLPWKGRLRDSPEEGEIPDVAVACQTRDLPGFYRQRLFTDRDVCVIRADHALSGKKLRLKDFLGALHVAVEAVEFIADPVDTWLQELRHARKVAVTVPHYMDALHLVARTEMICVVPERLALAYAGRLNLTTREVPLDVGTFDEFLLHPSRTHADPGCTWFRSLIVGLEKNAGEHKRSAS
jgi:DNA-binding transcriptional LysR family regulator